MNTFISRCSRSDPGCWYWTRGRIADDESSLINIRIDRWLGIYPKAGRWLGPSAMSRDTRLGREILTRSRGVHRAPVPLRRCVTLGPIIVSRLISVAI